jgi:hypothetical protein
MDDRREATDAEPSTGDIAIDVGPSTDQDLDKEQCLQPPMDDRREATDAEPSARDIATGVGQSPDSDQQEVSCCCHFHQT